MISLFYINSRAAVLTAVAADKNNLSDCVLCNKYTMLRDHHIISTNALSCHHKKTTNSLGKSIRKRKFLAAEETAPNICLRQVYVHCFIILYRCYLHAINA